MYMSTWNCGNILFTKYEFLIEKNAINKIFISKIKIVNPCNASPCLNGGTCTPLDDADLLYQCTCPSGCSGRNCEVSTSPCSSYLCYNGGFCLINLLLQPFCSCPSGYSGSRCEICTFFSFYNWSFVF